MLLTLFDVIHGVATLIARVSDSDHLFDRPSLCVLGATYICTLNVLLKEHSMTARGRMVFDYTE